MKSLDKLIEKFTDNSLSTENEGAEPELELELDLDYAGNSEPSSTESVRSLAQERLREPLPASQKPRNPFAGANQQPVMPPVDEVGEEPALGHAVPVKLVQEVAVVALLAQPAQPVLTNDLVPPRVDPHAGRRLRLRLVGLDAEHGVEVHADLV